MRFTDTRCDEQARDITISTKSTTNLATSGVNVATIISKQDISGCWREKNLIKELAKDKKLIDDLIDELGVEIVITQLVIVWMQKHHPQKQYALIIRKANSWLKKTIGSNQQTEEKLKLVECI